MIMRIIATALIQCTTRTHAGWMIRAGATTVLCSLAVMLDMAVPPEFAPDYTRKTPFRYCDRGHQADFTARHCEERSDEAIQTFTCGFWIASLRSQRRTARY